MSPQHTQGIDNLFHQHLTYYCFSWYLAIMKGANDNLMQQLMSDYFHFIILSFKLHCS